MSIEVKQGSNFVIEGILKNQEIQFNRTGFFQSRTVTVGNSKCLLQDLIKDIGERIHEANAEISGPEDLVQLVLLVKVVKESEYKNRSFGAWFFHLFSGRDQEVKELEETAVTKFFQCSADEALKNRVEVPTSEAVEKVRVVLKHLYNDGKPIKGPIRLSKVIGISENYLDWDGINGNKVRFYMTVNDQSNFEMASAEDSDLSTLEALHKINQIFAEKPNVTEEI